MVLSKSKKENKTLFIDASKEFVKVTSNNKFTEDNINKILDVYQNKKNKKYFSVLVPNNKIVENEYNLSVSTYVEKEDTREKIDIGKLNKEIEEIVKREDRLRKEIDKIIKELA